MGVKTNYFRLGLFVVAAIAAALALESRTQKWRRISNFLSAD